MVTGLTGGAGAPSSGIRGARFRQMLDDLQVVVWESDADLRVRFVSGHAERAFGYPLSQWIDSPRLWRRLIHPEDYEDFVDTAARLVRTASESELEFRAVTATGTELWVRALMGAMPLSRGRARLLGVILDVTDRRHAEASARQYAERMRRLLDHSVDPLIVHDSGGRIVEANRSACEALGCTRGELLRLTIEDVHPTDSAEQERALWLQLRTGRGREQETQLLRRDGTTLPVRLQRHLFEWEGQMLFVVLCHDTTERRRLEGQLRQSQKMEEVGLLTGGLAHDFQNMLTAIKGHAELLLAEAAAEPHRADLQHISNAADRATVLTRKLLAFSRRRVMMLEVLDVNGMVVETAGLLSPLIGEHIELRTNLAAEGDVRCDLGLFEQVLVNLMVNARDAMPAGGVLTVDTSNLRVTPVPLYRYEFVRPGDYVVIRVMDTGHGMGAETLKRVFDPFFTTKDEGKGSGLGLSTVYGIVKEAGGYVMVESEPGKGARFLVLLPRYAEAEPRLPPASSGRPDAVVAEVDGAAVDTGAVTVGAGPAAVVQTGKTVLVVEDEPAVRSLIRRILERSGHRVLEATDGSNGLMVAREHESTIDVLIADVLMPGMGGPALSRILVSERPGLRVILTSGYGDDIVKDAASGGALFLEKPFSPDQLDSAVLAVLAASESDLVPDAPES